jgi:hypothetical protein
MMDPAWMKLRAACAVLLALTALVGCGTKSPRGEESKSPRSEGGQEGEKKGDGNPTAGGDPLKLDAGQFAWEMKWDPQTAGKKYTGKWVEITATIAEVKQYLPEKGLRLLDVTGDPKPGADAAACLVPQQGREPGRFSVGQQVRLKGLVSRTDPRIGIQFPHGSLQQVEILELGPSTAIRATPDELVKDYEALDAAEAFKKYRGKTVILTGKVADVKTSQTQPDAPTIWMRSANGYRLDCSPAGTPDRKVDVGETVVLAARIGEIDRVEKRIGISGYEIMPGK